MKLTSAECSLLRHDHGTHCINTTHHSVSKLAGSLEFNRSIKVDSRCTGCDGRLSCLEPQGRSRNHDGQHIRGANTFLSNFDVMSLLIIRSNEPEKPIARLSRYSLLRRSRPNPNPDVHLKLQTSQKNPRSDAHREIMLDTRRHTGNKLGAPVSILMSASETGRGVLTLRNTTKY